MRDRGAIAFLVISFVLVAFAVMIAALIVARDGFGTNSAAWVQAGGSVAAIAGAVWLFRGETKRRRRERRAQGEEVAWAVRFALTNAQLEARTIVLELFDKSAAKSESPRRHWQLRIDNCRNVLDVFAKRLDHIHPMLNHLASNGALLLRELEMDARNALEFIERGERPPMDMAGDIARYEGHFAQLIEQLNARMRGVVKSLDENGDMPPSQRFDVWKIPDG
ncbi:hypothetical protein JQ609_06850 [Bradyrhizobium sp. AUGA SZCCT0169]|uniref:hypothetical protein n=1 Tax=Bradyrhizobium sp. AUGA SZCCT0169 TaxID=2807663 RepID=UPI001BA76932|nr:hypothetical protein [Bradyrhizobium sp. AUGA SZCCT0169]MBR1246648.1 hypothetical protein [Bradyrhizobium sp. AUGA SZCCT0169]